MFIHNVQYLKIYNNIKSKHTKNTSPAQGPKFEPQYPKKTKQQKKTQQNNTSPRIRLSSFFLPCTPTVDNHLPGMGLIISSLSSQSYYINVVCLPTWYTV